MMMDKEILKKRASDRERKNKELFKKLKKDKPSNLDARMKQLHIQTFEKTECLECANCCKSISPALNDRDIQRISKHLKMKPSELTEVYLRKDEEGDYVFRQNPCPFLMIDNYCTIYVVRPRACREYPHTDRKRFIQILDLTLKNNAICPAVQEITSKLHKIYR